jgi:phage protein D
VHWRDVKSGTKKTVSAGDPAKAKRLRKTHHTEADAKTAAESEHKRQQRAQHKFSYTLARGRPEIFPERPIKLQGWKPEIDALSWIVDSATHALDGSGGLTTTLEMETGATSAGQGA